MGAFSIVPRVKLAIADHGRVIAAVLVAIGLVAMAGAAWTLTHPATVEVSESGDPRTVGADVETRAVVTGNTSLWERGTTLEDRAVYPLESAPALTLAVTTSVPAKQPVVVSQELTLVYRASRDGEVFWRESRRLLAEERSVESGQLESTATVDVPRLREELATINEELTGLGRATAALRLNVSYRAPGIAGSLSKTAPLSISESGYWLGGSLDAENTHESSTTRTIRKPPDTDMALGLMLVGVVALGGAAAVGYASRRRLERPAIAEELERERYREWISTGQLGRYVAGQDVAMASLKDLVDVAIDSNNRVVHDRERDLFAVVANGAVYYYDPLHDDPELDIETDLRVPVRHDGGQPSVFGRKGMATGRSAGAAGPGPDSVSVTGEIAIEDERQLAVYRLSTEVDEPVVVEVVDRTIQAREPVSGFEPGETLAVDDGIAFTAAVSPHWTRLVKVAVDDSPDEPPETRPQVRRVTSSGSADSRSSRVPGADGRREPSN